MMTLAVIESGAGERTKRKRKTPFERLPKTVRLVIEEARRGMMRSVHLPAIDRRVSLAAYVAAIKLAKANPAAMFRHGLCTWWETSGAEIMDQFREGMMERINDAVPYTRRGGSQR